MLDGLNTLEIPSGSELDAKQSWEPWSKLELDTDESNNEKMLARNDVKHPNSDCG